MARILYGVHGTGHGHAMRALTVGRHYPQHEFLFVTHGSGADVLRPEFRIFECHNPETPVVSHRVEPGTFLRRNGRFLCCRKRLINSVRELISEFRPDVAVTDYEYVVPRAAHGAGIACVSLDHTHIVSQGQPEVPFREWLSYLFAKHSIGRYVGPVTDFVITSFFRLPVRDQGVRVTMLPPLLRETVFENRPSDGDHVVAYQGHAAFREFIPFLRRIDRPVMAYGLRAAGSEGNIEFKEYSEKGILGDLASCAYAICGGGHTLMSEALYYGKPLIAFPVTMFFEQHVNARNMEKLGYGCYPRTCRPRADLIPRFEQRLDDYRGHIERGDFCGNDQIFEYLDTYFETGCGAPA